MTVTNEQIQALLEKAESDDLALNGNEISNQLRHLADNEIDSDSFAVVTENYNGMETEFERPITDLAIDAAEVIDALLAERDADKALIAKMAKRIEFLKEQLALLANFNPDWDKLEAAYDSLREHMTALTAAQKRIAELEARTLAVKLPEPPGPMSLGARAVYCGIVSDVVGAFQESCAAAGITLVVGE